MSGLLGSDTNFAAVQALHPTGEPKARRIWALTPKTPAKRSNAVIVFNADWNQLAPNSSPNSRARCLAACMARINRFFTLSCSIEVMAA